MFKRDSTSLNFEMRPQVYEFNKQINRVNDLLWVTTSHWGDINTTGISVLPSSISAGYPYFYFLCSMQTTLHFFLVENDILRGNKNIIKVMSLNKPRILCCTDYLTIFTCINKMKKVKMYVKLQHAYFFTNDYKKITLHKYTMYQ